MKNSKKYRINVRNIIKGAIYAIGTALLNEITANLVNYNDFKSINLERLIIVGSVALIAYLGTKFLQDEQGNYFKTK